VAKRPAFQFYPADWRKDPLLGLASHTTKGIWIDILCCLWEVPEQGKLGASRPQWCHLLGCKIDEFDTFVLEAKSFKFCDVTICNDIVTVINRRMYRDYKERENTRLRVKRLRGNRSCNGGGNVSVTLHSSSSSSTSVKNPPTPKGEIVTKDTPDKKSTTAKKTPPIADRKAIFEAWNLAPGLSHHRAEGFSDHDPAIITSLRKGRTVQDHAKAIGNYSRAVTSGRWGGNEWTYSTWTLTAFLTSGKTGFVKFIDDEPGQTGAGQSQKETDWEGVGIRRA